MHALPVGQAAWLARGAVSWRRAIDAPVSRHVADGVTGARAVGIRSALQAGSRGLVADSRVAGARGSRGARGMALVVTSPAGRSCCSAVGVRPACFAVALDAELLGAAAVGIRGTIDTAETGVALLAGRASRAAERGSTGRARCNTRAPAARHSDHYHGEHDEERARMRIVGPCTATRVAVVRRVHNRRALWVGRPPPLRRGAPPLLECGVSFDCEPGESCQPETSSDLGRPRLRAVPDITDAVPELLENRARLHTVPEGQKEKNQKS